MLLQGWRNYVNGGGRGEAFSIICMKIGWVQMSHLPSAPDSFQINTIIIKSYHQPNPLADQLASFSNLAEFLATKNCGTCTYKMCNFKNINVNAINIIEEDFNTGKMICKILNECNIPHRVLRWVLTLKISNSKKEHVFGSRIYEQIMWYTTFLPP